MPEKTPEVLTPPDVRFEVFRGVAELGAIVMREQGRVGQDILAGIEKLGIEPYEAPAGLQIQLSGRAFMKVQHRYDKRTVRPATQDTTAEQEVWYNLNADEQQYRQQARRIPPNAHKQTQVFLGNRIAFDNRDSVWVYTADNQFRARLESRYQLALIPEAD